VAKRVRDCALGAWKLFGCQDFARVDFRLDENDNVFILEVNPNPDISPDAGFAAALCAAGISFDGFIKALLENARTRISGISSLTKCKPASKKKPCRADIRRCLAGDRDKVLSLVQKTQVFRPEELAIAQEVFDDAVEKGPEGHYQSFVAEAGGKLTGWLCFGPTPCTIGTFDIYWIAVTPEKQSCGIGTRLMQHAEKLIAGKGGRMAVAETSGTDRYSTKISDTGRRAQSGIFMRPAITK